MAERKDGGPAFPLTAETALAPVTNIHGADVSSGMSLRDWFAGQALSGVIRMCAGDTRREGETIDEYFARAAYEIADAMLEARK